MRVIVHHENGSEAAGSDAGDGLKGELEIRGRGMTVVESEVLTNGTENLLRAADVAGRALAGSDDVSAARFEMELRIESNHTENLADGNFQFVAALDQDVLGQIAEDILRLLKHGNGASLSAAVFAEELS